MDTDELKQYLADNPDETAYDVLLDAMPNAASRFHRLESNMARLLEDVREHFPDALFYTSGGRGFSLVLGDTHSGKQDTGNQELQAMVASRLNVEGGDW